MAFAPINVDLGIGEALKLVGEILSRRGQRSRDALEDVVDDAEAAEMVVRHLDKLFTDLLGQFASTQATSSRSSLAAVTDEARKFLFGRELLPILDSRRATIRAAAEATGRSGRPFRDVQPLLASLAQALDNYRNNLTQAMGGTAPGLLANVYQLAYSRLMGGKETPAEIREEAELTLRNHDFSLSEEIYKLTGRLKQAARA